MGVSGSGKSAIGQLLAEALSLPFIDGDEHHPAANIEKMSQGISLVDRDREPWLDRLHDIAVDHLSAGCVIACSALKAIYRERLSRSIATHVAWVHLDGSYDLIFQRMNKRKGHFMKPKLLRSQFDTLEVPEKAIEVDISDTPSRILEQIIAQLSILH